MPPTYHEVYARWRSAPEAFWAEAAEAVHWYRRWDAVLDASRAPFYRWFPGAETNSCYNALDRHVEDGRADQVALIYDSPVTSTVRTCTYRELRDEVARFAGVLAAKGVGRGDRVVIYMPMIPETVIGMLACARIGAIHSVVFGGFASAALASRLTDAQPKADPDRLVRHRGRSGGPLQAAARRGDRARRRQARLLHRAPASRGEGDAGAGSGLRLGASSPPAPGRWTASRSSPPIRSTSSTPRAPPETPRASSATTAGMWSPSPGACGNVYGVEPGEVYWAASDVGWVVGHSYIVYGPLFHGNTTVLYEGKPVGTPDAGAFWRVIAQHGVRAFFTAPTAFRAIKRDDPEGEHIRRYDLSQLRALFLAGERCDPPTLEWAERQLGIPVIDHWWQTETGWPVGCNCAGLGLAAGQARVVRAAGAGLGRARAGRPRAGGGGGRARQRRDEAPACPGCHADALEQRPGLPEDLPRRLSRLLPHGRRRLQGRGRLPLDHGPHRRRDQRRRAPAQHGRGWRRCWRRTRTSPSAPWWASPTRSRARCRSAWWCSRPGRAGTGTELVAELVELVRQRIGPVASFKTAMVVKRLPKTRSGKIVRGTVKKIADGEPWTVPATIDDSSSLEEISAGLSAIGYPRGQVSRGDSGQLALGPSPKLRARHRPRGSRGAARYSVSARVPSNTHLAVRHQGRFPPPKVATVTSQAILAYVAVALAAAVVLATYSLAGVCRKEISRP